MLYSVTHFWSLHRQASWRAPPVQQQLLMFSCLLLSRHCCLQDARVLQQQLATEASLRQNAMEDYRAMQSQLVALSGDLDVSQQKQRALQQQLAAEQVQSQASFEAVE